MRRIGLGKGLGRGYFNIVPNYDSYIHSLSAKGMKSKQKGTLFNKPKYDYLSEIIDMKNPDKARGSVKELKKEFRNAETKKKKLRIKMATVLAQNRAKAILGRDNLSKEEQRQFRQIEKIYRFAQESMRL